MNPDLPSYGIVPTNQGNGFGIEGAIIALGESIRSQNSESISNDIGAIVAYGGTVAPTGWLFCEGQAVSRVGFSTLFGVIGTSFGVGDGSTTFNLPNLKGRVPLGVGDSTANGHTAHTLGQVGGEETHLLTTPEIPAHLHPITTTGVAAGGGGGVIFGGAGTTNTGNTGGGGAHNNLTPYVGVNYMIRYAKQTVVDQLPKIPYAFRVWRNAAMNTTANGTPIIVFDSKLYDLGNNLNLTTGVFTAPISGLYHFDWGANVSTDATARNYKSFLFINGVENARGAETTIAASQYFDSTGGTDVFMNTNDTADIRVNTNGVIPMTVGSLSYTRFSGHLVSTL